MGEFDPETPHEDAIAADNRLPTSKDVAEAKDSPKRRARAALAMAVRGASDDQIADLLKYTSPEAARVAWEGALASSSSQETDRRSLIRLSSARYEAVLRSLAPAALSPTVQVDDPKKPGAKKTVPNEDHLPAAKVFLSVVDKINVLHGLNAPTVNVQITPAAQEFSELVDTVATAIRQREGIDSDELEGDIFAEGEDGVYGAVEPGAES